MRSGSETVGADVLVLQRNVGVGQVGRRGIAHAGVRAADFPIVEDLVLRNQLREDQRCTDRRIDRRHGGRAGQRREPVRADRRIDVNEIPEAYLHRSVDGLRLLADVFTGHFGRRVRHVDVADVEEVGKTQQVAALSHHVVFFVVEAGADVGRQAEIVAELFVDVEQYVGVERVIGHLLLAVMAFRLAEQSRRRCVEFTLVVGVGMVHADTARKVDPVGDLPLERAADDIAVLRGVEHVAVGVRIVADGSTFSDGEQHLLPVLSDKEYITETLAMPVRGEETRTFSLDSLFNGNSRTATDRRLTVEFTGNPAWYAVQALPVLSEPSTDNAISWATAFYANTLAGYIANSQPRIKTVFDNWRLSGGIKETFLSRLEQNQDVKNILLGESPWLLEATTEAEQQQRIATLFDVNQLNYRNMASLLKLKELQGEDGAWSWFGGMSGNRYVTGYITGLLVRLSLLTDKALPEEAAMMKAKAFDYLNKEALKEYRAIRKAEKNGTKITVLSDATMEYMYLVSLGSVKLSGEYAKAFGYFLAKLGRNLESGTMIRKAQTAVILQKAGHKTEADEFIASIKEHLVQTDEMGAHFAFHANPYTWGMMPVPAHVAVMEALREAGGNDALVEEMKLWLLKQKQTTSWDSPVATADAVYALLCQGSDLLESKGDVRITLGDKVLETFSPAKTTVPGLGYVKEVFAQGSPEVKAKSVTVEKRDAGIAWGAVYAQFLSPISDVKQQGGALNIEKKLFVERISADGQKSLQPLTEVAQLFVGDKIVSRLTVRLDRAMDFVQLKDQRGACFEPENSLSGYRWNNGVGYYAEVEDAGTNFFFDHLGKGVYVLEHSYRVARGGTYETGLATVQCAYAPEYASHSAGGTVIIK